MSFKEKTAGLFYPLALFSVGMFVIILGLLPDRAPYVRSDFEMLEGVLTEDANNTGPRFRTFVLDKMPETKLYLDDVYLTGGRGNQFADSMKAGARVKAFIPNHEYSAWHDDPSTWLHVHGLVVNDFTVLDFEEVIADQPDRQRSQRIAFLGVGGLLLLGGVIFFLARKKKRAPVVKK